MCRNLQKTTHKKKKKKKKSWNKWLSLKLQQANVTELILEYYPGAASLIHRLLENRMATMIKADIINKFCQRCQKTGIPTHCWWEWKTDNVCHSHCEKQSGISPKHNTQSYHLTPQFDSKYVPKRNANPRPHKNLHTFYLQEPNMETIQLSIKWWMDK